MGGKMKKSAKQKNGKAVADKSSSRPLRKKDDRIIKALKKIKATKKKSVPPPLEKDREVVAKVNVKLGKKTLNEFKQMLIGMRQRLTGQIATLKDDSLQREDSVNSEEDGTDAFERQFALNIASSENESVLDIDEALRRIEQGAYGVCVQCMAPVEMQRLKAMPFAKMCIKCKAENEKGTLKYRPMPAATETT
jgi:RNA polymerase-binding protein DksA